jgi:hypothetical protein
MLVFAVCGILVFGLMLVAQRHGQIGLEGALFLTKNLIRELKNQLFLRPDHNGPPKSLESTASPREYDHFGMEYPFSNMMNLIFPIDSRIQYNKSNETHEFPARYASFSPIVNYNIDSGFGILDDTACSPLDALDFSHLQEKIIVVMRGNCTFVRKITNLLDSGLDPQAVLVANNVRNRGLVTMYSTDFNQDGTLRTPVLFISFEGYEQLSSIASSNVELRIAAAALGGWINLVISVMLSPPLVILIIYGTIRCGQIIKRKHHSRENEQLVRNLKVYIYNRSHLIPASDFYDYIRVTNQTHALEQAQALEQTTSSGALSSAELSPPTTPASELPAMVRGLNILVPPDDYFNATKCSICLEKFHPLRSRVLLLNCKHFYHEQCLSNWLINFKRSCPLCNNSLKLSFLLSQPQASYGALEESVGMDSGDGGNGRYQEERSLHQEERSLHQEERSLQPDVHSLQRSLHQETTSGTPAHDSGHTSNSAMLTQQETFGSDESIVEGSSGAVEEPAARAPPTSQTAPSLPPESTASFTTAKTQLENPTGPPPLRPRVFSRPSQLLRFTTLDHDSKELSASIDSGELE